MQLIKDPETDSLKSEISTLEAQIAALENERSEIEREIYLFEIKYDKILGAIILQILELRKNRLHEERLNDSEKDSDYYEAEKDYKNFEESYNISLKEEILELTPEEQNELILTFRKASKLCHPDIVADEQKEMAQKVFVELKKAYDKNDLKRVKEIYEDLLKGVFVALGKEVNEKQKLLSIIAELKTRKEACERVLNQLKENKTYQTIQRIDNLNEYFERKKNELIKILEKEKSFPSYE